MVSKRWQVANGWIQHAILIGIGASFFFWLQQDLVSWQKVSFLFLSLGAVCLVGFVMHRRFANKMVKVFKMEHGDLSWIVQRELKQLYIPFTKKLKDERMELRIHGKNVLLTVEAFPLNLMIDDHLDTVSATMLTVTPIRQERPFITTLCQKIDKAYLDFAKV